MGRALGGLLAARSVLDVWDKVGRNGPVPLNQ